jgi:hypothetical protein
MNQAAKPILYFREKMLFGRESALTIFHLSPKVWPHVKPKTTVSCVQVVQPVRETAKCVFVNTDLLTRLENAEQSTRCASIPRTD